MTFYVAACDTVSAGFQRLEISEENVKEKRKSKYWIEEATFDNSDEAETSVEKQVVNRFYKLYRKFKKSILQM